MNTESRSKEEIEKAHNAGIEFVKNDQDDIRKIRESGDYAIKKLQALVDINKDKDIKTIYNIIKNSNVNLIYSKYWIADNLASYLNIDKKPFYEIIK